MNDIIRRVIESHGAFRLVLAIPGIIILSRYALSGGGLGQVIEASGEWAVRMLIITLAVTPIRMMFRHRHWPMWLFKRRRELGVAAFLYAMLHMAAYVLRQSSPAVLLYDAMYAEYLLGWIALTTMFLPFVFSNDVSLRLMGPWWKMIQRLVYVSAVAAFLHWIWIKRDDLPAYIHFGPLVALELYRLWFEFTRPSRRHRGE
ncbi:MAG: ferric reductase-like transmembrane domain-containing protein [Alphaproteobacteria bacterium]|nr:ferric reductase-like transmembrane domain-containing protein [Alphaproteobacteria bacterium]